MIRDTTRSTVSSGRSVSSGHSASRMYVGATSRTNLGLALDYPFAVTNKVLWFYRGEIPPEQKPDPSTLGFVGPSSSRWRVMARYVAAHDYLFRRRPLSGRTSRGFGLATRDVRSWPRESAKNRTRADRGASRPDMRPDPCSRDAPATPVQQYAALLAPLTGTVLLAGGAPRGEPCPASCRAATSCAPARRPTTSPSRSRGWSRATTVSWSPSARTTATPTSSASSRPTRIPNPNAPTGWAWSSRPNTYRGPFRVPEPDLGARVRGARRRLAGGPRPSAGTASRRC